MMSFDPRPLDAAGVLFRTTRPGEADVAWSRLDNGWGGRFARGLEIVQAKGDHWSLVRDERNTAALAQQINAVLDRYVESSNEADCVGGEGLRAIDACLTSTSACADQEVRRAMDKRCRQTVDFNLIREAA